MEGRLYLRLLLRHWLAALTAIAVCLAAGAGLYLRADPAYQSTVVFSVEASGNNQDPSELYQGVLLAQVRAATLKDLVTGPDLARRLGLRVPGVGTRRIEQDLAASVGMGSVLISVTVTDSSRSVVRALGNALVSEFPVYVRDVQTGAASKVVIAVVVGSPQAPRKTGPGKVKYAGLGLLGGVLLTFLLCALLELGNRRLRDPDDVRALISAGAPVIDLRRANSRKSRSHPRPARNRHASLVDLRRSGTRKQEARWVFELSALAAAAEVANRPLALVPLGDDARATRGTLSIARLLTRGRRPVAIIDSDHATGQLSTLAAVVKDIGVQTGPELVSSRRLQDGSSLVLVTPVPDVSAVVSVVRANGGIALVAAGAVVQQPLMTQAMDVAVLVVAGADTKAELRATIDLLHGLDCRLAAVVLVAGALVRR